LRSRTRDWWRSAGSGRWSPGCDDRGASWMVRMSVPDSSKWTAKTCRNECGVIGLGVRQRRRACWHARSTVARVTGRPGRSPGYSQWRSGSRATTRGESPGVSARASRSDPSGPCLARPARPSAWADSTSGPDVKRRRAPKTVGGLVLGRQAPTGRSSRGPRETPHRWRGT
jgi:hypothetical protein